MVSIGSVNCQYLLSFCCTSSKTALANSTKSFTQGSSSSPPKFSINHWILALSFSGGTKYRPGMSGISPFQARGTPSSKILHRLPVPIGPHGPVESPSISRIPGELLSHTILNAPDFISQDLQGGPVVFVQDGKLGHLRRNFPSADGRGRPCSQHNQSRYEHRLE